MIFVLFGCASIAVPNYIKDKNPYSKKFYGQYKDILKIASDSIEELGWKISSTSDPLIFENSIVSPDNSAEHILIFAETKQDPWILGTTYKKLNVYVRAGGNDKTEVELRYIRINSTFFMKFYGYKADRLAKKIFDKIEEKLK